MQFTGNKPLFEEIADYYEKLIRLNVYPVGSYLPSVRETALASQINPNTVQRGYQILVAKKLVNSIPKKGYQVIKADPIDNETIIKDSISKLIQEGIGIEEIKKIIQQLEEKKDD